jgi:hypothetical protein
MWLGLYSASSPASIVPYIGDVQICVSSSAIISRSASTHRVFLASDAIEVACLTMGIRGRTRRMRTTPVEREEPED